MYAGCHLVVVYLYQFEVAQKLIPLQPANTTTSMVARWGRRGGGGGAGKGYIVEGRRGGGVLRKRVRSERGGGREPEREQTEK